MPRGALSGEIIDDSPLGWGPRRFIATHAELFPNARMPKASIKLEIDFHYLLIVDRRDI
jgi:hypothetical protein